MHTIHTIEEEIRIGSNGRLSGILSYPEQAHPVRGVLLCSPHPNFAGNMQNNVIVALARRLSEDSVTLRFDYRGVGTSRIDLPAGESSLDYWDAVEQAQDYSGALADATDSMHELSLAASRLSLFVVGFSFGALVAARMATSIAGIGGYVGIAPPLTRISFEFVGATEVPGLMISGLDDFVYDADRANCIEAAAGGRMRYLRLPGVDHFHRDRESELADQVAAFLSQRGQS